MSEVTEQIKARKANVFQKRTCLEMIVMVLMWYALLSYPVCALVQLLCALTVGRKSFSRLHATVIVKNLSCHPFLIINKFTVHFPFALCYATDFVMNSLKW